MRKLTQIFIVLLHIWTLPETVTLLNKGQIRTALWHALATGGITLIIVAISWLASVINHKAGKSSQQRPKRKPGKGKPVRQVQSWQRVSNSTGK